MPNGRVGGNYGPDYPGAIGCIERVASSPNVPGVSIAMAQSSGDPECVKSLFGSDPTVPVKSRKLSVERSDPRKYVHQRYFMPSIFPIFHSITKTSFYVTLILVLRTGCFSCIFSMY